MAGGTLVVTRAAELHAEYKKQLEELGFEDVTVTSVEKDGLNTVISNKKPRLLIIGSGFYQAGTPYMIGELVKLFPKLNIAIVSVHDFPLSLAPWFIWHGAKSYLNLWEGYEEFHRGLQIVRNGRQYISPKVQKLIDQYHEWPDTKSKITKRQKEILILLCCGFIPVHIGEALHISKRTVDNHLNSLYNTFHVGSREEMIALAWEMELVTPKDIRFYDRKKERGPLPEWAAVKRKCDRFYFD
jgi:two-component system secretion system response regulator SalR